MQKNQTHPSEEEGTPEVHLPQILKIECKTERKIVLEYVEEEEPRADCWYTAIVEYDRRKEKERRECLPLTGHWKTAAEAFDRKKEEEKRKIEEETGTYAFMQDQNNVWRRALEEFDRKKEQEKRDAEEKEKEAEEERKERRQSVAKWLSESQYWFRLQEEREMREKKIREIMENVEYRCFLCRKMFEGKKGRISNKRKICLKCIRSKGIRNVRLIPKK